MRTQKQTEYRTRHRRLKKSLLDEIRDVPCVDCGMKFPPVCMDFDHLPGTKKSFGIMNKYGDYCWDRILDEVAKCEIVCSNCHRIRTESRR